LQRTTNRKWHMATEWSRRRWCHVTLKGQTRDPNTVRAQYLENYLIHDFVWGMTSGRTKNFLAKWAWPTSRDPTIIGIRSNISPKLFQLVTSNLVSSFDCRGLHTMVYCGAVWSAILATAWLLVHHMTVVENADYAIIIMYLCLSVHGWYSWTVFKWSAVFFKPF